MSVTFPDGKGAGYLNYTHDGYIDLTHFAIEHTFPPFSFEVINFRTVPEFCDRRLWPVLLAIGLYLLALFQLPIFMKDRKGLELKWALVFWNGALGLFSIIGFCRMAPEFFSQFMQPDGLWISLCIRRGCNYPTVFWASMFVISKFVELGDTIFLILRKRPVSFLQWYHHVVTLFASYVSSPFIEPVHRYYVVMNYGVHSLMYPYFAVMALGIRVPRRMANFVTTCQLAQMIIGLVVNLSSAYFYYAGYGCHRHPTSIKIFAIIYGSFVYVFGKLYVDKVVSQRRKGKET